MNNPTLKASLAIRIGAALRPQCQKTPFICDGSCAIGAWFEGMGYGSTMREFKAKDGYNLFWREVGMDPAQLSIRNDRHGWTRERIADWLEAQGK